MKLMLRREQFNEEVGLLSKSVRLRYKLYAKLELSPTEETAKAKYGLVGRSIEFRADRVKSDVSLPEGSSSVLRELSLAKVLSGITLISDSSLPLRELEGELRKMAEAALAVLTAEATYGGEDVIVIGQQHTAALQQV